MTEVVFDDAVPKEKPMIETNLYFSANPYDYDPSTNEVPYFWLLLGHQESIWPLTWALGLTRAAKLPFSGAYFFEFYVENNKEFVRVVYRDD